MSHRIYQTEGQIERARPLWEAAPLLAERVRGFYQMKLYQIGEAYLEVTWHKHFNVVVRVSRFTDEARLEPYLKKISLKGLFH